MGEGLLFWAGFSVLCRSEENTSQPGTSSMAAGNITSQQSKKHLISSGSLMAPAGLACRLWFLLIFQFNPDQQKTLPIIYANWFISQSNVGLIEIKIRMIKGSNLCHYLSDFTMHAWILYKPYKKYLGICTFHREFICHDNCHNNLLWIIWLMTSHDF